MPRLFIDRPVLATVISVVITLMGGLAIFSLPIAQYPEVVPPQVRVTAAYRGANAQDVEKTVAEPIEQQLFGLDDLLYLSSSSSNDGVLTITRTFEVGTDLDLAAVQVQNKVALAEPHLARRGQAGGGHRHEGLFSDPAVRERLLSERTVRRPLPEQLRQGQLARSPRLLARRRWGLAAGRAGVCHAHLAQPGQARHAGVDRGRRRGPRSASRQSPPASNFNTR